MKRLIDSVQKIHQSEESKAALLDTLEKAQRTRHGKEHAARKRTRGAVGRGCGMPCFDGGCRRGRHFRK